MNVWLFSLNKWHVSGNILDIENERLRIFSQYLWCPEVFEHIQQTALCYV